jgi:two-component system response regulator AtoC
LDPDNPLAHQVRQLEIRLISKALQQTVGNRLKTAKLLGITRQGLYKKMKRYQTDI